MDFNNKKNQKILERKMNTELQNRLQQNPAWIFLMLIVILIGASPSFTNLVLDFCPNTCIHYKKWITFFFIVIGILLFSLIYWLYNKKRHDSNKMTKDELLEKSIKKAQWGVTWQNIFKYYPLNVITLKIIPLFICWAISSCINKKYKSYFFDSFYFPKYWKEYNYEEVISKFFKSMFRVYIKKQKQSYEVKFGRDFQSIEVRRTDRNARIFKKPENKLYEKIFSTDDLKHIKIFTWIFPFGLYWNSRRIIKKLISKKKPDNKKLSSS